MPSLPEFELHRPETLDEAVGLLSPDDLPFMGGTELLLAMRQRLLRPRSLVDLKGIVELGTTNVSETEVSFGSAVTHRRLVADAAVGAALPILTQVLNNVGNRRVQTSGTPVGNLCFAEPKSDVIPLLIALGASVDLRGADGGRTAAVEDFVVGPYATTKLPDELVVSVRIPLVAGRSEVYLKLQTMERPTVGVAAVRWGGVDRVVVGASGIVPVVAEAPSGRIDPVAVAGQIEPLDDLTGSAQYKRMVTGVFVRRALAQLEDSE